MTPSESIVAGEPQFHASPQQDRQPQDGAITGNWLDATAGRDAAAAAAAIGGHFALAAQRNGQGAMAIDRFAVHTLCWRLQDSQVRFAERADALAGPDDEIDPQAIFDYLYFHAIPSPRTIFKGIHRLPPGHVGQWTGGKVDVRPYWQPVFEDRTRAPFEPTRQQFLQLLERAVADQLDGTKGACFLSGGTDSSTVAGLIGKVSGRPAATYSIGFEAEGYDEMAYARIAAKRFGTEHHEYYVTPEDLIKAIPLVAGSYDQPFGNSSALPAYYCALKAREDGVTKMLAGDGGDELFGGNSRYAKQRLFDAYRHLPSALRSGLLEPVLGSSWAGQMPLVKKGASYVDQARRPMPDRLQIYNLLFRLGYEEVLCEGFRARVDASSPLVQQRGVWQQARTSNDLNRTLAFDWRYTLAESDLPKVRGTTALAGVNVGFPLLDTRLADFSMRLHPDDKLKGQKLRWFFKEALRGFLPDEILTKRKQGFGLPFGVWLTRHAGLMNLAKDSLGSLSTRGIVRPEFIRQLIDRKLAEHPGYFGEMIWILMMLEQWLRAHRPGYRL